MKPNTIVPELTHRREDIARHNRELRQLCAAILPAARKLVQQGVARATAREADAVQTEEADTLLKSLLAELDEYIAAQPDAEPELPHRELADMAPDASDEAEEERQWIDRMAGDWALAAAAFWLELGELNRQASVMANVSAGHEDDMLAAFDLVASRFHVGREGRALLYKLNLLTRPVYTTVQVPIEISAALYVPELAGNYVQK